MLGAVLGTPRSPAADGACGASTSLVLPLSGTGPVSSRAALPPAAPRPLPVAACICPIMAGTCAAKFLGIGGWEDQAWHHQPVSS